MKISRDLATPITIGSFGLMAVTGILMFFHLDSGLNKAAHEWLSWIMVAGVATHTYVNWNSFKRYFMTSRVGQGILVFSTAVIAGSFVSLSGNESENLSPPALAMQAITKAPLSSVALLADKPVEQLISDLNDAGIKVTDPNSTLDREIANNRGLQGKAIRIVFNSTTNKH